MPPDGGGQGRRLWTRGGARRPAAAPEGVGAFGVACLAEGMELRRAGVRGEILILGYTPRPRPALLGRWRLTQTVADARHGEALAARGLRLRVHLALDTGMHRLGIPAEDPAPSPACTGFPT